jgi:fumarate reductase subunit D
MHEGRTEPGGVSLADVLADPEDREVRPREVRLKEKAQLYLTIPPRELVFWSLFSAGGMVTAFLIPINVAILGIALAAGWLPDDALSYERVLDLLRHPLVRVYVGILIVLPLYHWAHRFRYAIHHQLGIHGGRRLVATLCYGTAVAGTALTLWVLIGI